ncbi:hypothetical protein SAMN05421750_1135 [Agrobacterium pusense]|nr:hypothetical protein SAMN05421750_1135 [Agrobacterium pusense]
MSNAENDTDLQLSEYEAITAVAELFWMQFPWRRTCATGTGS